ncbi:UDP-2,4-diacetamido-2,4,6-trideoxy-beta-L-altropyranose hydrolase [Flagellimonas sp.]|uniref:UDP-2,4-diacetamido-2,4, 6-trideoxy-beta-L-altropyranose hydrolase n=1 Tax=Flagellimonas sp. TaxID=2058762 RepID=UPI003BAF3EAF
MTKKLIFRADGNSTIGLGHLYRLFSLVEITKHTFDFVFLTQNSTTSSVIPKEYATVIVPNGIRVENEPEWLASTFSPKEYCIIADGYQFNGKYQNLLKQKGFGLMYIDDLATEHMYADIIINHSPYIQEKQYLKESYTKLALGTNYALVRPLFLEAAKVNRIVDKIENAFVCFGGADPFNLTIKAVRALLQIPRFKKIYVVLGGSYRENEIFDLERKHTKVLSVNKNVSQKDLLNIMCKCHFAIASASTILYELCCVKMPILSGFYVDNQELIYKGFLQNAAIYGGDNMKNYEISDFLYRIEIVLGNRDFSNLIKEQKKLFDDEIAERHLKLIGTL